MERMQASDNTLVVTSLAAPLSLTTARKDGPKLKCSRKVTASVMVRVRHGTIMVRRNITWMVSDTDLDYDIIGRFVLKAIGLDNRALLAAACDRYNGVLDIPSMLEHHRQEDNSTEKSVFSLLRERAMASSSTFHSQGGFEDDYLEDSNVYIDLGDDPLDDLRAALALRVVEARAEGMSAEGCNELSELLKEYEQVFE